VMRKEQPVPVVHSIGKRMVTLFDWRWYVTAAAVFGGVAYDMHYLGLAGGVWIAGGVIAIGRLLAVMNET
jgi:predicted alpha/beta hydrolase